MSSLLVRQCPLGPFRSCFAPHHDQWPFICRHHHVISLAACRLAAVNSLLSVWLVWHISSYCQVQVSKARIVFEELMYWFVKTRGICSSSGLWRQYPLVEEIIYIDKFKSCTTLTTSLILDLGCIFFLFLFSLVLSTTLQMQRHCIHVAFERGC